MRPREARSLVRVPSPRRLPSAAALAQHEELTLPQNHLTGATSLAPGPGVARPQGDRTEVPPSPRIEPALLPVAGETVERMFAAQVERTPDLVAVTFRERQWTYRE